MAGDGYGLKAERQDSKSLVLRAGCQLRISEAMDQAAAKDRTEMNALLVQIDKRVCPAAQSSLVRFRIVANGDVELVKEFREEVLRRVIRLARETDHVS
jgi:hypothetical protein